MMRLISDDDEDKDSDDCDGWTDNGFSDDSDEDEQMNDG